MSLRASYRFLTTITVEEFASHFGLSMAWLCQNLFAALQIYATVSTSWHRVLNLLTSTRVWTADPAGDLLGSVCVTSCLSSCFTYCFLALALVSAATNGFFWSLVMLSLAAAASSLADVIDHSSTGNLRNRGPFCHSESSLKSSWLATLVIMSAIFCGPEIHHQF